MLWKFRAFVFAGFFVVSLPMTSACGRFKPARSYQVDTTANAAAYATVLDVLKSEHYVVLEQSETDKRVKVTAHVDEKSSHRSFITLRVSADRVELVPAGHLVHSDGGIHHALADELSALESKLKSKLAAGASSASARSAASSAAATSDIPSAWIEPAADVAKWGPGNFTCLPVALPRDEHEALSLRLSTGESADVTLSIAYAPELCRSSKQCKLAGGCPALGIGDSEQVKKLAARISRGEVTTKALLLHQGKPAANIDLGRHGSIAQSMSELKH